MAADPEALSRREREVLGLLALGHTNREIADLLHISIRTAEFHRASIQRKLGLTARSELVRFALAQGVVGFERAGDGTHLIALEHHERGRY
jgi:DNA-binding CsgD family transcriptional regulator